MNLRPYSQTDYQDCLAIFDSNTPDYFDPSERAQFVEFLQDIQGSYFVVTQEGGIVLGCGGYWRIPQTPVVVLVWGMVLRSEHRRGIGKMLLRQRLKLIAEDAEISVVILETSQHTAPFFQYEGFIVQEIIENGFGPGLHQYKMALEIFRPSLA